MWLGHRRKTAIIISEAEVTEFTHIMDRLYLWYGCGSSRKEERQGWLHGSELKNWQDSGQLFSWKKPQGSRRGRTFKEARTSPTKGLGNSLEQELTDSFLKGQRVNILSFKGKPKLICKYVGDHLNLNHVYCMAQGAQLNTLKWPKWERKSEKKNSFMCMYNSLCCTPKTNTVL